MAVVNLTLTELEDRHGPIILLVAFDLTTHAYVEFRVRDLPLTGIEAIRVWLNARLST